MSDALRNFSLPSLPADIAAQCEDLDIDFESVNDFPDDSLRGRPAISMGRLGPAELTHIGRRLFSALSNGGVSQQHVGYIFILAWHLKQPGSCGTTKFLLPDTDLLRIPADITITTLDDIVSNPIGTDTPPIEHPSHNLPQAYSYLATSFLKLFTRSPQNYLNSWDHIVAGYKKFYSTVLPLGIVKPHPNVINQIHSHFSMSDLMKSTLYRYLYNANNQNGEISSIQRYLYDMHLSHTGMHVVPIAYKLCMEMNCSSKDLLEVIYTHRFKPQIEGLIAAFNLMKSNDQNHQRQMWKYGRIFNSRFLASLQTRLCPKFCYILACALKIKSAEAHAGILDIKAFEEISEENKMKLQPASKLIIDALNTKAYKHNGGI